MCARLAGCTRAVAHFEGSTHISCAYQGYVAISNSGEPGRCTQHCPTQSLWEAGPTGSCCRLHCRYDTSLSSFSDSHYGCHRCSTSLSLFGTRYFACHRCIVLAAPRCCQVHCVGCYEIMQADKASNIRLCMLGVQFLIRRLSGVLQAKQPQQAVQVFMHMQDLQLPLTLPQWCQFIDALARERHKGARSHQLPYQFWTQLCQSGTTLDVWSYVTGV